MADFGYGKRTIQWEDSVVQHDLEAFPDLELVQYDGNMVRAYEDRPRSIYALFERAVSQAPDREFVVFPDQNKRYTYREFKQRVEQVAAGLQANGVDPGDRISIILPNCPQFVEVFFAAARIGAIVMPLNVRHTTGEFEHILTDSEPAVVVVAEQYLDTLEESSYTLSTEATFVVGDTEMYQPFDTLESDHPVDTVGPEENDEFCVLYTSGTTGLPKGVPGDHFHLVNGGLNNAACFGLKDGTRGLFPTPLFHVMALVSGLISVLAVAGTGIFPTGFSPESFLQLMEDERPSYVMAVPTNYILALEKCDVSAYNTASVDTFAYGGAPMPTDAIERLQDAFPGVSLCNSYGKTESVSGLAAMLPDQYTTDNPDAVGIPTPVMRFMIVDESGEPLPPGEEGELVMAGPIIVNGYQNRPAETDAVFDNGWHHTGDICTVDENGIIRLLGRKKDMIIRGGENIYPSEVEEVLNQDDDIVEAAVTNFPDDVLGERVLAAVVPSSGARVTEDDLEALCRSELADYKVPDIFRILDELPRTAAGTVDKEAILPTPLQMGIKAGSS
ncbi:O-succinylbenzoic acid--CoA ligase [Halobellus salinus]|uniref:O-succinylbenzoic acid--CoA ligase n=1 Tax=Halobellus salinus TaxID=931585 RepID=A0A830ETS2_9EURY|nr:class I adenylate-forming enzyme family protein [Halobellus salinus]GGJ17016.1 O-succinylbenzoic acid--CoA ligase [Halobellus salinus]SMP34393.1 long-chain acyl-CoA synthetase [Halobellus salinus]